jgi:pentatricopeptide repeat protein
MLKQDRYLYEFGAFRLDTSERLLLREGVRVPLTEKAFDTLAALVRRGGRLASKEELMAEVWPGAFVEENNLDKSISAIRQALGEKASAPEYVETVRGRGYRFLARVSEVQDEDAGPAAEGHSDATFEDAGVWRATEGTAPPAQPLVRRLSKSLPLILGVGLLAAGLCLVAFFWLTSRARQQAPAAAPRSIAVLPFKPLVAAGRDESLELGMADTLITRLSTIRDIVVRPVSAVRNYTGLEQEPLAAGRELGVEAVLDGSIQRAGERVRVTVRLVRVADGVTLWADEFDETFTDIFAVQDAISGQVTRSLALRLSGEEEQRLAKRYTENADAYLLYLKGRHFWNKRTEEATRKSIEYFEQAIAADPEYALAYSGLADAYWILSSFDQAEGVGQLFPQAKAAALTALALDDTLAEAHTSLAQVKEVYALDFTGAEREYKRAIELNPNYATAHHRYGWFLNKMGRVDEAHAELRRALELDPLSLPINTDAGMPFQQSREYGRAVEQYRKTIELDPNFPPAHRRLATCYSQMGRHAEAIAEVQKALALSAPNQPAGGPPRVDYQLAYIYAKAGRVREARQVLDEMERSPDRLNDQLYFQALTYAELGDKERAFALMEKLYEIRSHDLLGLKNSPAWDGLRGDPRFQDLLRRFGLIP